jgi:hypothetical protein
MERSGLFTGRQFPKKIDRDAGLFKKNADRLVRFLKKRAGPELSFAKKIRISC